MFERLVFGFLLWLVVVAAFAFSRYSWQNLALMGGGFGVALLVLAYAFDGPGQGPVLFLVGAALGGMLQHGFEAEKRRRQDTEINRNYRDPVELPRH